MWLLAVRGRPGSSIVRRWMPSVRGAPRRRDGPVADDINLPNLVSHLNVNLDGLNGTIADATRQGSSVGAALGGGIQNELRGLLAHLPDIPIDANSDEVDRDLARVRGELQALSDQRIGIDIPIDQALRRIRELTPHLQRLGETHPVVNVSVAARGTARQLDEILAAARRVDTVDPEINVQVDEDRPNRLLGLLGRMGSAGSSAGLSVAAGFGKASAAIGSAVPLLGSVVTALANVAPAAGVAVTGMAAVQLASGTVKLAAVGMDDALTAALDPSKAEDFDEALKKLSPNAAKFATAVRDMGPALREVQQSVQNEVFRGLADNLERTAKSVLPVLRTNLLSTATALGDMAAGVMGSAKELADNGTLGKALGSASKGLRNLSGVPGVVVTALGQIAAAAGPSFESLTDGAAHAAAGIGERLGKAFESGAMQDAIEHAMDLLGQMITVGANVAKIIGGIFNAVPAGGGGMIGILQDVTGEIAKIVNTKGIQDGLGALFQVMGTLGATVAPLLGQALSAIAPVLTALGPPAETLIKSLGDGLSPIIVALGPVLEQAAGAVGALVVAASPLLPVIGQLAASLLPALTPLLEAAQVVFEAMAPVVGQLAGILQETLAPIIAQLPALIQPLADLMATQLVTIFQLLGQTLVEVGPSLVQLGVSAGELLVAATPLIVMFAQLTAQMLEKLVPAVTPLIGYIADLAAVFSGSLAATINNVVIPAVQIIGDLMKGDFSSAANTAKQAVQNMADRVAGLLGDLPGRARSALSSLGSSLVGRMNDAGSQLRSAAARKIDEARAQIGKLPGAARAALGDLSSYLSGAGSQLIQGMINGVRARASDLAASARSVVSGAVDAAKSVLGIHSPSKVFHGIGVNTIQGFINGIDGTTAQLKSKLAAIMKELPANTRSGVGNSLKKATAELSKLVTQHDAVVKKLATAQKKLDDLVKARNKAASDITSGILSEANITTGHADVNSVSAITVGLQQALKATKAFDANIAKLKKSGLRSDLLQEIGDAGVAAGGATAAALAKATPAELKRINDLQAQLAKSATATGNTVGDALYSAGIRAAQGLVAGLKSQEAAIEKQMRKIAENMLKTVKKTHKTKSPSRAFHDIGVMDGEGLRLGFESMGAKIRDTFRSVAGGALDLASGVGGALSATPTAGQLAAVYAGSGQTNHTYHINLNGSRATPEDMVRALSWQALVGRK
ncbi:phage tail protein [Streptomyces sp. NPDC003015]